MSSRTFALGAIAIVDDSLNSQQVMSMAAAPTVSANESRSRRRLLFALTSAGVFLVTLDVSIANVTLPAMQSSFHGSDRAALSWVISAYAIAFAAALVPGGRLADRAGRRLVFIGGFGLFAAGSLVCGLAPSLPIAILGRVIQGVGAAAGQPASLGLLLQGEGAHRRTHIAASWGGMGAVGIGLGPVVGGALTSAASWRLAYLVNLPIVAIVACLTPLVIAESARHPGRRLPDPLGALLLAAAASLLTLGISEGSSWGWLAWRTIGAVVASLLATTIFVRRCWRVPDPLLDLRLLGRRDFGLVTVVTVFYSASFFGLLFSAVLFLTDVWHLSMIDTGLAIAPMAMVVVLLSTRVGGLSHRIGLRPPLIAGVVLMAVGMALDCLLLGAHREIATWVPVVMLIGLGIGLCYPLLSAAAVSGMPVSELAAATAVNQAARQLGAALGVAAAVASLGTRTPAPIHAFDHAWLLGGAFALVAAAAATGISSRRRAATRATQGTPIDGRVCIDGGVPCTQSEGGR